MILLWKSLSALHPFWKKSRTVQDIKWLKQSRSSFCVYFFAFATAPAPAPSWETAPGSFSEDAPAEVVRTPAAAPAASPAGALAALLAAAPTSALAGVLPASLPGSLEPVVMSAPAATPAGALVALLAATRTSALAGALAPLIAGALAAAPTAASPAAEPPPRIVGVNCPAGTCAAPCRDRARPPALPLIPVKVDRTHS